MSSASGRRRSDRGPLIQKQGFVKRAPSGKLSAFKKWEKKWCVFALSNKNGPVLDLFEDRMSVDKGPTSALARYELKETKQVCHAIECKVPYSFIIVTETRIISLAALSQVDANSWVSALRRVLEKQGALPTDDHTYEVSGTNLVTRQDQERAARSRRPPPPTPPGSDTENDSTRTDPPARSNSVPEVAPPLPPLRADQKSPSTPPASLAPALPKRGGSVASRSDKPTQPPPLPTSERPMIHRSHSARNRSSIPANNASRLAAVLSPEQMLMNKQAVLDNYQDSPDTTYESGDRRAIAHANKTMTLNANDLSDALNRFKDMDSTAGGKSSTLTPGKPPVYASINKNRDKTKLASANGAQTQERPALPEKKRDADPRQRPIAAARKTRVEHDFSPSIAAAANVGSDSSSSSDNDDRDTLTHSALPPPSTSHQQGDDLSTDEEDTYANMDGFADSVIGSMTRDSIMENNWESDDSDDRYVVSPVRQPAHENAEADTEVMTVSVPAILSAGVSSAPADSILPTPATLSPPPAPTNQPKPNPIAVLDPAAIDNNIYENSKTVKDDGKVKAMPTAAPRRAKTITAQSTTGRFLASQRPVPVRRESIGHIKTQADDEQEDYENALGLFGTGVTHDKKSQSGLTIKSANSNSQLPSTNNALAVNAANSKPTRSPKLSKTRGAQSLDIDKQPPLPPLPTAPVNNPRPLSAPSHPAPPAPKSHAGSSSSNAVKTSEATLIASDIPLADGESCDDTSSPLSTTNEHQRLNPAAPSEDEDIRIRLHGVSPISNTQLPGDEAPPPYTPPRLLNDSQISNNMDCIAEGNSEEDDDSDSQPPPPPVPIKQIDNVIATMPSCPIELLDPEESEYDSHCAFIRHADRSKLTNRMCSPPRHSPSKDTNIDADIRSNHLSTPSTSGLGTASSYDRHRKLSPHTPPGTPPAFARLSHQQPNSTGHTPLSSGNYNSPDEDVHIRLEDTFPRMPQRSRSRNKATSDYKDTVVLNTSTPSNNSDSHSKKLTYRKSFSVLPSSHRMTNGDKTSDMKPKAMPRRSLSTEELKPKGRPPQAEYDYLVKLRVQKANRALLNSQSSSSDEGQPPVITRRRPNRQANADKATRRKSAPPNSLAIQSITSTVPPTTNHHKAAENKAAVPSPAAKDNRSDRRSRKPLEGGTLLREGKIFKAPPRDRKNMPLKQAQTEMLQEEIAHSYGVKVTVWRKDLKYALFVDIMGSAWVAGWNQKERPLLSSVFHLGDRVVTINNEPLTSTTKLMKLIKRSDSETKFEIVLRRIPFGKAYFIHKNMDYEEIGMELKPATAEVVVVSRGGMVAQQGLRVNPNRAFGSGQCHWAVTEVNHRPLSLITPDSEAASRLNAVGKDVTFVVQPQDFVELLRKALKSTFGYKDYTVS